MPKGYKYTKEAREKIALARKQTPEERFWSKVDVRGEDECWDWQGQIGTTTGYGRFSLNHKDMGAHRMAWILAYGPIPEGKCVLHSCDNRPCVNKRHLFLGDKTTNMADKVKKDRQAKGEQMSQTRLTDKQALEIRRLYTNGYTQTQITKLFDVGTSVIHRIVHRQSWKHI